MVHARRHADIPIAVARRQLGLINVSIGLDIGLGNTKASNQPTPAVDVSTAAAPDPVVTATPANGGSSPSGNSGGGGGGNGRDASGGGGNSGSGGSGNSGGGGGNSGGGNNSGGNGGGGNNGGGDSGGGKNGGGNGNNSGGNGNNSGGGNSGGGGSDSGGGNSGGGGSNSGGNNSGGGGSNSGGGNSGVGGSDSGGGGSNSGGGNNSGGGGSNNGGNGTSGGGGTSSSGGGTSGGGGGGGSGGGGGNSSGGGSSTTSAGPVNAADSVTRTGTQTKTSESPSKSPSPGDTTSTNEFKDSGSGSNLGAVDAGSDSTNPGNKGSLGSDISGDPSASSPSNNTIKTLSNGKTSTSGGSIAAAVIFALLFVMIVAVFILRKRSKTRREEQGIKWWFTRTRASRYGDNEALNSGGSICRSSFATTHDHSKALVSTDMVIPPPPMAEIGRPNGTDPALVLDINTDLNRFSIGSGNSHNSQFLVVHHRESLQHDYSASVMSCTESFSFPKPPPDRNVMNTRSCIGSPKHLESEVYLTSSEVQPTTQAVLPDDPFSVKNPFDDSESVPALVSGTFPELETIRRPFFPQMQDELEVNTGDFVRIVQIFDDGWALVQKSGEQGLIPLETLDRTHCHGLI